jgi:hypothetical protein
MKGATLKSKINGALFIIDGEFEDNGQKFYSVLDMASGQHFATGKEWFEKGLMQNLEVISHPTEKGGAQE